MLLSNAVSTSFFPCMKKIQHLFPDATRVAQRARDHPFFEVCSILVLDVETTSMSVEFPIQLWIICAPGQSTRRGNAPNAQTFALWHEVRRWREVRIYPAILLSFHPAGLVSPSFSQRTITSIRSLPLLSHASDDASPSPRSTSGAAMLSWTMNPIRRRVWNREPDAIRDKSKTAWKRIHEEYLTCTWAW